MTKTSKGDDPSNVRDREFDNLTVIKGIGAKTQKWLRQSFKIHTFGDLAALSADEVESQFKAEGRIISRNVLDEWIAQAGRAAEELAAIHSPASRGTEILQSKPDPKAANSDTAYKLQVEHRPAKKDWKPVASFVVEFQHRSANGQTEQRTTVHHMEDDKDVAWSGIEREQLQRWMLERLPTMTEEVEKRNERGPGIRASATALPPVNVQITQVRLLQSPETDTPLFARGQAYPGFIDGAKSFTLETTFNLSGPGAADTAKTHSPFVAQIYAHNLSTAENTHLGDTPPDSLADSKFSYTARLAEATLAPGIYRFDCLASLQGVLVPPGHQRLPRLQVV